AGGKYDFSAATRATRFLILPPTHTADAPAIHLKRFDEAAGFELQVFPVQHRLQKAARRRPSSPALLVDMEITNPLVIAGVEVLDRGNAVLIRRLAKRLENLPAHTRIFDAPFAAHRVMITLQKMIDMLAKIRAHVVP